LVAHLRYRIELWMVISGKECRRRTWAFARALPRNYLQFPIRMLIRRMPEERRWPALRRFTESVDRVAGDLEQRKRLCLGTVLLPLGTSRIGLIWHRLASVVTMLVTGYPELTVLGYLQASYRVTTAVADSVTAEYPWATISAALAR
jgi:hypothetical protein